MDDSRTPLSSLLNNPPSYGPKTFASLLEGNRTDILHQELSSEVEMSTVHENPQQNDQDISGVKLENLKCNEKSSLAKLKQTKFFRTDGSEVESPYQKETKVVGSGSIISEGENALQTTFATLTQGSIADYNRKKRGASAQDKNTLSISFLNTETESITTLDMGEKGLSDKIDKQIDDIFANEMPPTQDWTRLKNICKTKFARMKHVTPQKVRIFLNKVEKLVHSSEDVATQIMDKKININFAVRSARETAEEIASSETAVVNFVKDVTWAPLTYQKIDIFCNPANSTFISQTFTQTILSMLAMVVGAVLYHVIKGIFVPPKDKKETEPNKIKAIKSLFIWLGTGLSIPGWNALQVVGKNVGLAMNMSAYSDGYFSALFPGIPDGPTQGIASLISSNIVNNSWNKFRLKTFFQQLLIFVTFGAVPGAIWQLVYQLITGPIGAYGTLQNWEITVILGLALAGAVYISNVAYGAAYERFVNKSHFVIELEPVDDLVDLKLDFLLEDYDNIVSYNGRAGAPNRTSIVILRHDSHSL